MNLDEFTDKLNDLCEVYDEGSAVVKFMFGTRPLTLECVQLEGSVTVDTARGKLTPKPNWSSSITFKLVDDEGEEISG